MNDDPRFDDSPLPQAYARLSPPALDASALVGETTADVAIVGGGYTGLSCALHLAEKGTRVILLEGREIGSGGSGRAFGQLVPYAKHDGWDITAHYGVEVGERITEALGAGPAAVLALIDKYGMKCGERRLGILCAAHSKAGRATLEKRVNYLSKRGTPIELLDATATARIVGSGYYSVAALDRRGGLLIPLALVRGLANAARKEGAVLHERSPVTGIESSGATWRVVTDKGAVTAKAVFLATGAYTTDLWPGLRQSMIPMRAYQIVSKPLSENVRATVLPGGHSITDTRRLYSGVRVLSDGRIHVSADGPAFARGGTVFRDKADRRIRDVFPQISSLEWEESWSGWVDMTTDQYPHLHELAPGLWGAIGLCGRGIVWGTLIGREVAWRLMDADRDKWFMPVVPVRRAAIRFAAAPLIGTLMKYYRALDYMELAGYVRPRKPAGG